MLRVLIVVSLVATLASPASLLAEERRPIVPKAFPPDESTVRACFVDEVGAEPIAVFWYDPTKSSVAFLRKLDDRVRTIFADKISPSPDGRVQFGHGVGQCQLHNLGCTKTFALMGQAFVEANLAMLSN